MRIKTLGALGLMAAGIGAVVFVTVGPTFGATSSSTRYLTAQASVTDVIDQIAATGSVAASETSSLAFGSAPTTSATGGSASTSSSSSGSGASGSSASSTWIVKTMNAAVGQAVKAGDVLATSDTTSAQASLAIAKADLASAQARLKTDKAGPTALDKAAARIGITQAQQSLANAGTAYSQTVAQNNLKINQAYTALVQARQQLANDKAALPAQPANVLAQDQNAITQASNNYASARLGASQSNTQAANQISSAKLGVTSAKDGYKQKVIATPAATIASDQAAVDQAQATVATAQETLADAILVAPADGIVTAVNIAPGAAAPSGAAITLRSATMQVSASVPEADLPSLKLGQDASVTLTALGTTVTGTVAEIDQSGSASSSGGVVTYGLIVALPKPPAGTAPGMSAQVSITTHSATGVLAVPAIALQTSGGQYDVRVLDASGQPQSVPVQVGLVTSSLAEITSGISAGTVVVVGTTSTRTGTTTSTTTSIPGLGGGGGFGGGGGGSGRGTGTGQ